MTSKRKSKPDRMIGYPKRVGSKLVLQNYHGETIGHGHVVKCRKLRPGEPGAWIDSQRCTYRFNVKGIWYSMRGYGEGIAASGRRMKNPPRR